MLKGSILTEITQLLVASFKYSADIVLHLMYRSCVTNVMGKLAPILV